jgi:hypothetical protein
VILTGCRQAGKTSLLNRLFLEHAYVSLDIPLVAETAELSGQEFLETYPPPLIVDEVQYAPTLLRYIKADIDAHRSENGRFLITGSQKFSLMEGVTESLAGRSTIIDLFSLSAREFETFSGERIERKKLIEWMFMGGYPELHAQGLDPERFYADYLVTYLERDVRSVLQVRSLRDFERFIRLCASRIGQLLSMNSLASDLGISPNTVRSWLSILESSNILYLLEPFYQKLGKRVVKTPKLYFVDTGLACNLTGMRHPSDLEQSPLLGQIFEAHVLGQIIRHYANQGLRRPLYFYRDHHGREIDFLIPSGGKYKLIECKWTETATSKPRSFLEFESLVSVENIHSETIVTHLRGQRRLGNRLLFADSIDLKFLDD